MLVDDAMGNCVVCLVRLMLVLDDLYLVADAEGGYGGFGGSSEAHLGVWANVRLVGVVRGWGRIRKSKICKNWELGNSLI